MSLNSVVGNLLTNTDLPAIGHGVNTVGVMGGGIALPIGQKYPEMKEQYAFLCRQGFLRPGDLLPWRDEKTGQWVYNMASQDNPGPHARLDWLTTSARLALGHADEHGIDTVGIPAIGCGIGGLEWADVEPALEAVEADFTAKFLVHVLP